MTREKKTKGVEVKKRKRNPNVLGPCLDQDPEIEEEIDQDQETEGEIGTEKETEAEGIETGLEGEIGAQENTDQIPHRVMMIGEPRHPITPS